MGTEREAIDRGWFYVLEPDRGAGAPEDRRIVADDGRILTRRPHGWPGRVEVVDEVGLPRAAHLRAAAAVGAALEARGSDGFIRVVLDTGPTRWSEGSLHLDGRRLAGSAHHVVTAEVAAHMGAAAVVPPVGDLPDRPVPRILFFESLMNSDMPHNDTELSQGVLHMISALGDLDTEVVLADVKMSITGADRSVLGLERLKEAVALEPGLVCITLLEGYFDGVVALIAALRDLGCRARIAVGGVMPSLAPEHVAAHLRDVSFVCRGAGEVFVPRLARILGPTTADDPLTDAQRGALLGLDGLIAMEPGRLLAANTAHTAQVADLDRVSLDLSHVTARHVLGGIEIATSRGCIHRCTFCSILGREWYQARSVGSILDVLAAYEARFHEIWGDDVPEYAWRVHVSDDDFACDRARAAAFFRELPSTRFRLSSAQVSVADLCRRDGARLTTEPDVDLLDAIRPECFADADRPIAEHDFVADFRSRRWSSYLQLGVESYCDRELVRLGKGYRRAHVRTIVAELARRRLHMDGYFILANSETTGDDLIDALDEIVRLKAQWARWFHVRFPIVPRLVSYFTAASHRRLVRQGKADRMVLRDVAAEPGFPELDYPFVDHDEPADPWVSAVGSDFFTDSGRYSGSLVALRERWVARLADLPEGPERRRGERLVRRLDDRPRRTLFSTLALARRGGDAEWPGGVGTEADVLAGVASVLGPAAAWLPAYRRYTSNETPRLVVIPTWQCELRCGYCFIPKQDGRVMSRRTLERSVDLLLASDRDALILQFFGGEALLEWELVQHGIAYGAEHAAAAGKQLSFIVSSNGWSIDAERLAWLAQYPVKLELSLDGTPEAQNTQRPAAGLVADSYERGIAHQVDVIRASGLDHEVIMVVHPRHVAGMADNLRHVVDLGFERVQINFALGFRWSPAQQAQFADGLFAIGRELRQRWARGEAVSLINLEGPPMPIRLNGEVTVDYDGTVYGGNGFLHETRHKDKFVVGHLDELGSFDRYWMDAPENTYLLEWSYPDDVTANNLAVGRIFTSFVRWMRGKTQRRSVVAGGEAGRP